MVNESNEIVLEPQQGAFLHRLARRMRDVGFLSIVLPIVSMLLTLRTFFLRLSASGMEDAIANFSSYFNGNRQVDWGNLWMLVDVPINILVGILLIQGSRYFRALAKHSDSQGQYLFKGLSKFKRVLDAFYVQFLLAIGLLWLIVFVS